LRQPDIFFLVTHFKRAGIISRGGNVCKVFCGAAADGDFGSVLPHAVTFAPVNIESPMKLKKDSG
jgi:hypothetical protein